MKKTDSLYTIQGPSLFKVTVPHRHIKINLSEMSYKLGHFLESIKYYKEAVAVGSSAGDRGFEDGLTACINSYAKIGNQHKAINMLEVAHNNNLAHNLTRQMLKSTAGPGKENGLRMIKMALELKNIYKLEQILIHITEENVDPDADFLRKILFFISKNTGILNNSESKELSEVKAQIFHMVNTFLIKN